MKKTVLASAILLAIVPAAYAATELTETISTPVTSGDFILTKDIALSTSEETLLGARGNIDNVKVNLNGNKLTLTSTNGSNCYNGVVAGATISGKGSVVINQANYDNALGYGSTSIAADSIAITSAKGSAIWNDNGTHTLDGNGNGTITLTSKDAGHGIYVAGSGSVVIQNFKELIIDSQYVTDDGYAISNNGGNVTIKNGGKITLNTAKRGAIASISADSVTSIEADVVEISSTINGQNELRKTSSIYASAGELSLTANTLTVNVEVADGQATANAIGVTGGKLALNTTTAEVNGDIAAGQGELNLNGNLVFNGENANIGNLTGENATFTITSADQTVDLTNNTTNLTLAATGELNDKLGVEAFDNITLGGTKDGVQLYLAEGESSQSTTATLDQAGNLTNVVTKNNTLMDDSLSLATGTVLSLNRIMMNDVRKRMGDLRSSEGKSGAWARYDGGRLSGEGLDNDFNTIQVGVDTVPTDNGIRFGIAANYTNGDADYTRGSADMDAYGLAAYATWMGDSGLFTDIVARMATAKTDMKIDGYKTAKLDNIALSLSGEVGYRYNVTKGFFVEPQGELTYTYVDADTMKLSTGTTYEFDSVNSLIGRLGVVAGMECPNGMGNVYARVSAVHEFLGDAEVTAKSALGGNHLTQGTDGKDTWVEFGIGANINVTPSTYVWADVERTEGAALDEDWRATVGVRYAF